MVKVNVLGLDTFVVINKTILNDQDRLSLTLLYQPIVGSVAISLYVTLWGYLEQSKLASLVNSHQDLMCNMQMKLEDILEAREKLEAIGLLKTYYQKGEVNKYVYELYNPLNAYDFLSNPILNTALYNNVSKREYKRIIQQFSTPKIDLSEYEDISCSFKDVYHFAGSEQKENNIKKLQHLDLSFEPTIEFHEMLGLIPEEILNYKSINKKMQQLIYQLAFVYNFDNQVMSEMIIHSVVDRKIDVEQLKTVCRNYYRFEQKGKVPGIVFANQPLNLRSTSLGNTRRDKMIYQFETTRPYEFLSLKQDGQTPTSKDLQVIEYLLIDQQMKPGVVNVLIDYVLKINNNKLTRNFVEQIAAQWKRSHIETVSDAMDFAKEEFHKSSGKKSMKPQKVEMLPSWFDEDIQDELLTEEELKQFEESLKGGNA